MSVSGTEFEALVAVLCALVKNYNPWNWTLPVVTDQMSEPTTTFRLFVGGMTGLIKPSDLKSTYASCFPFSGLLSLCIAILQLS